MSPSSGTRPAGVALEECSRVGRTPARRAYPGSVTGNPCPDLVRSVNERATRGRAGCQRGFKRGISEPGSPMAAAFSTHWSSVVKPTTDWNTCPTFARAGAEASARCGHGRTGATAPIATSTASSVSFARTSATRGISFFSRRVTRALPVMRPSRRTIVWLSLRTPAPTDAPPSARSVIVALASFVQLAAQCAPSVHVDTLAAVARAESRFETNAINDNSARRQYAPPDRAAASAIAVRLIALGHSVDLGIMQINSANLHGLGLSVADAFDPCTEHRRWRARAARRLPRARRGVRRAACTSARDLAL